MQRKKVVCFVNHTAETGGAEFALLRLVGSMDRGEWHPLVVFGEDGPAAELFRQRSVETYVLPLDASVGKLRREGLRGSRLFSLRKAVLSLGYMWRLARFFRERAVEIVHTNSMKAHILGGLAARLCRIPLVWHLRDALHPAHLPSPALRLMRGMASWMPQRVVCVSESVARYALGGEWAGRAKVVYDGLEEDAFLEPASAGGDPGKAERKVGIAGRLSAWKGQHVFLEAAAKLLMRGHRVRFEILGGALFGEEVYAQRLQDFVRANAMEGQVEFAGFVSDVSSRIRSWDVFVHASTAPDPCPNVVLEAMAAGVAVVGSDDGGVPELLEGGRCGLLFKPDCPHALCDSIESLLLAPDTREQIAVRARQRAMAHYRCGRVAQEVARVWTEVFNPCVFERRKRPWLEVSVGECTSLNCGTHSHSAQPVPRAWEPKADPGT